MAFLKSTGDGMGSSRRVTPTTPKPQPTMQRPVTSKASTKPTAKPMFMATKKAVAKVSAPKKAMPTQAKGKAYGVMGTKPVKPMK